MDMYFHDLVVCRVSGLQVLTNQSWWWYDVCSPSSCQVNSVGPWEGCVQPLQVTLLRAKFISTKANGNRNATKLLQPFHHFLDF